MALTDLTRISTAGIATGSTIDSPILRKDVEWRGDNIGVTSFKMDASAKEHNYKDNVKLSFGDKTNGDLQLYHSGSHSFIKDTGTGNLKIVANVVDVRNAGDSGYIARFKQSDAVELYFSNTKRFETTNQGAVVSGILTATGSFSGQTYNTAGIATFYDLRVSNNLTVEGTTTTLDTNLVGVDRIEVGANSNTVVGVAITQSGTADILQVYDSSTPVIVVKDGGKIGIGTTNPTDAVDIVHGSDTNNIVIIRGEDNTTEYAAVGVFEGNAIITGGGNTATSTGIVFRTATSGVETERLRITSGGKVGIGTDNAERRLHVVSPAMVVAKLVSTHADNRSYLRFMDPTTTSEGVAPAIGSVGDNLWMGPASVKALNIVTGTGFVGIAVTDPERELHVHGNLLVENNIGNHLTVRSTVDNGNDPNFSFEKGRGGSGTTTIIQDSDDLGRFTWKGYDGSAYIDGAFIMSEIDGTPGIGTMPTKMALATRASGEASATRRLGIESDGTVQILNDGDFKVPDKIIHYGDTDTAIRFPANNTFSVETAGSERLRIASDGKVGIGTINPAHDLHVYKSGGDSVITIESTGNGNDAALNFRRTSSGGDSKGAGSIYVTGNTGTSEAKMQFGVGHNIGPAQSPRMTIMGNGEVGIGTDDPTVPFHVFGSNTVLARFGNTITNQYECISISNNVAGYPAIVNEASGDTLDLKSLGSVQVTLDANNNDNNTKYFRVTSNGEGSSGTELFRVHESGNVGIGTDNPSQELEIWSDSPSIKLQDTNPYALNQCGIIAQSAGVLQLVGRGDGATHGAVYMYAQNNSEQLNMYRGTDNYQSWYTASNSNSVKMRLIDNGYVGIGTISPTSLLHLDSNSDDTRIEMDSQGFKRNNYIGVTYADNLVLAADEDNAGGNSSIRFRIDNTEKVRIADDGKVGIGTVSPTRGPLHINEQSTGDVQIHLTNNETGTTSSDGFTIYGGAGTNGRDMGFVNREEGGAIEFNTNMGGTVAQRMALWTDNDVTTLAINHAGDMTHSNFVVSNHDTTDYNGVANRNEYPIFWDIHFTGDAAGGNALTSNKTKAGLRLDGEYSCNNALGTDSGERMQIYGCNVTMTATRYCYTLIGGYLFANTSSTNSATTTQVIGSYGYAQGYIGNSSPNKACNIYGGHFIGYRGGETTGGHAYGVMGRAQQVTNGPTTPKTGDMTGIYGEVEVDEGTVNNAYSFRANVDVDNNTGSGHGASVLNTAYLYHGSYSVSTGATCTTRRGIWLNGCTDSYIAGDLDITGALSKGSGSFRISHPLVGLSTTKDLVHSFVEGPQCDLIYRGKIDLVGGTATVNIDTKAGMTEGTFVSLCRDIQCFTSNETGWTAVKGSVTGNKITIIAQDNTCTDTISWMVVGERQDDNIKASTLTDNDGNLIVEPDKKPVEEFEQPECEKNIHNPDPNDDHSDD